METHQLIAHPDFPPGRLMRVEARVVSARDEWLRLRWRLYGAGEVVFPAFAGKGRADDLWRRTCFETFLRPAGHGSYVEINLSPSERWAAYDFSAYRTGMADRPMPREPDCTIRVGESMAIFDVAIPLAGLPPLPWSAGLCAIVEERGGRMSYWALAHPPGKPDFHHADCFALTIAAPQAP